LKIQTASAALGGGQLLYRLVERFADGGCMIEEFIAPDDAEALARARDVAETEAMELWNGERRILD
jgi:hypothetical protein